MKRQVHRCTCMPTTLPKSGCESIIKGPDTDALVIGIALTPFLSRSQLYFYSVKIENVRTLRLQAITQHLGSDMTKSPCRPPVFTWCDSVSTFCGNGKVKAVKLLVVYNPALCAAFQALGKSYTVTEDMVSDLEVFICKFYGQKKYQKAYAMYYGNPSRECYAKIKMPCISEPISRLPSTSTA